MKKVVWLLIGLLLISLAVVGCGKQEPAPKAVETKTLTLAMLKLTSTAPLFIGMEKGFFKEQGIELDVQWFEAAHPIAVATASSKVDIGATGITASLFNMVAGGQKLVIAADKGREEKGFSSSAVLVTSELYQSGVNSIEQLKGKRVGITQTGSTFHYMIGRLLETKGLSLQDIELVPLGKISSLMASLESKQVDAVILNEPNVTKVEKAGYGKVLAQVGDVIPYQTSGLFFSPNFAQNKELAVRFLKGYIKSCRYYYDAALVKENGKHVPGKNFEEVVQIIAKYTGAPAEDIKAGLPYMDRDGRLLSEDIAVQIDWYVKNKMIEKPVDAKQVADTALFEEALRQMK